MATVQSNEHVLTVTLNTAIDRVLEVPNLQIGSHGKAVELRRYPAGKAINVSRALARLGRPNTATGFIGAEQQEMFERFLAQTGPGRIDPQLLSVRGRTRENITLVDPINHTDTHIRDQGFEVTARDIQRMQSKLDLLVEPGAYVVVSGSLPQGMGTDAFEQLLQSIINHQGKLILDVGGSMLYQLKLKPAPPLAAAVPEITNTKSSKGTPKKSRSKTPSPAEPVAPPQPVQPLWLIKPNRDELAELQAVAPMNLSSRDEVIKAASGLQDRVRWIVVTLGADGAILICPQGIWWAQTQVPAKSIVNTVGCGDCMVAGLVDGQISGLEPPLVLRRAVAVATANALSPGVADFNSALVGKLEQAARVEQIS